MIQLKESILKDIEVFRIEHNSKFNGAYGIKVFALQEEERG